MNLIDWMNESKAGIGITLAGVLFLGVMTACSGWSLYDNIDFENPKDVREVTGGPAKVTLNQAPFEREKYVQAVELALEQFDFNWSNAEEKAAFINSLFNTGIDIATQQGVIPAGGAIALLLGGLGGLFFEKPGSAARRERERKEAEDKGYDMARLEARNQS